MDTLKVVAVSKKNLVCRDRDETVNTNGAACSEFSINSAKGTYFYLVTMKIAASNLASMRLKAFTDDTTCDEIFITNFGRCNASGSDSSTDSTRHANMRVTRQ